MKGRDKAPQLQVDGCRIRQQ